MRWRRLEPHNRMETSMTAKTRPRTPTPFATVARALLILATMPLGVAMAFTTAVPAEAMAGATYLCGPTSDYSCTGGGYAGWDPWGYSASSSIDGAGRRHNCTSYAAMRAAQNGARNP